MEKNNQLNVVFFSLPLAAFVALAAALVSQCFFGLHPCKLCIYQRIPYFAVVVLFLLGLFLKRYKFALGVIFTIFFAANCFMAIYHAGVEYDFFKGPDCAGSSNNAATAEEMLAAIMQQEIVSCKDAAFYFLGLSMAGWNAVYSFLGAIFSGYFLWKSKKI